MSISATNKIQQHTAHKQLKHALPDDEPPAKMANLPTETAPITSRATLSSAVDHLPVALSNTSVALHAIPAQTATHKRLKIHMQKIATA